MARRSSVKGAARLRQTLRKTSVTVTREITQALTEAGELISRDAKNNAVKRTGRLKDSIRFAVSRDGLSVRVGSFGGKTQRAYHAALVEFGTAPGPRVAKNGQEYQHPGSAARPWLLPAWEKYKRGAFAKIKQATINALDEISRNHGDPA
jgi:HK97 gp10 family phage protein